MAFDSVDDFRNFVANSQARAAAARAAAGQAAPVPPPTLNVAPGLATAAPDVAPGLAMRAGAGLLRGAYGIAKIGAVPAAYGGVIQSLTESPDAAQQGLDGAGAPAEDHSVAGTAWRATQRVAQNIGNSALGGLPDRLGHAIGNSLGSGDGDGRPLWAHSAGYDAGQPAPALAAPTAPGSPTQSPAPAPAPVGANPAGGPIGADGKLVVPLTAPPGTSLAADGNAFRVGGPGAPLFTNKDPSAALAQSNTPGVSTIGNGMTTAEKVASDNAFAAQQRDNNLSRMGLQDHGDADWYRTHSGPTSATIGGSNGSGYIDGPSNADPLDARLRSALRNPSSNLAGINILASAKNNRDSTAAQTASAQAQQQLAMASAQATRQQQGFRDLLDLSKFNFDKNKTDFDQKKAVGDQALEVQKAAIGQQNKNIDNNQQAAKDFQATHFTTVGTDGKPTVDTAGYDRFRTGAASLYKGKNFDQLTDAERQNALNVHRIADRFAQSKGFTPGTASGQLSANYNDYIPSAIEGNPGDPNAWVHLGDPKSGRRIQLKDLMAQDGPVGAFTPNFLGKIQASNFGVDPAKLPQYH